MYDDPYAQIYADEMNNLCFDCGIDKPEFISINNGIFLCERCTDVHLSFPEGISNIVENDLDRLTDRQLEFLIKGGNTRLNDFILDEYPNIQDFPQKLIYKTVAMDYYRKRLRYNVIGGPMPVRPSQYMGAKLIADNKNAKNKTYRPTNRPMSSMVKNKNEEEVFNEPMFQKKNSKDDDFFNKFFGGDFFGNEFFDERNPPQNLYNSMRPDPYLKTYQKPFYPNPNINKTNNNNNKPNISQNTNQAFSVYGNEKKNIPENKVYTKPEPEDSKKKKYFSNVRVNKTGNKAEKKPEKTIAQEEILPPNKEVKQRPGTINPNRYVRTNFSKPTSNTQTKTVVVTSKKPENKKIENNDSDSDEVEKEFARVEREAAEKENKPKFAKVTKITNNNNDNESNNPFAKKDSTDLIILPGQEENKPLRNKKPNNKEIPVEFKKEATNLNHLTSTINENDEFDPEKNPEISENDTNSTQTNDTPNEHRDSIRNKYKKKKSQTSEEEPPVKKNVNENKGGFDKKTFVKKISKMNITETNWNINQLGDINTYPEALEVEAD